MFFEAIHKLKHVKGMSSSNYRVCIDPDICIGCGLCVKRCPMYALQLKDAPEAKNRITVVETDVKAMKTLKNKKGKVSTINPDQCLGCGVCVYKWPSKSLVLEQREALEEPPLNARELAQRAMAEMAAGKEQIEKR